MTTKTSDREKQFKNIKTTSVRKKIFVKDFNKTFLMLNCFSVKKQFTTF